MKNVYISLTVVLGLFVSSNSAAPVSENKHIAKRDEAELPCPSTLSGPSKSAYFGIYIFSLTHLLSLTSI
jgi:hypothetical protein